MWRNLLAGESGYWTVEAFLVLMIELCSICDNWTVIDLVHVDTQLGMTEISQSIASEKVTGHLSVAADFCDDIGGDSWWCNIGWEIVIWF